MAAELPTAFPYLGSLAAVAEAHRGAAAAAALVALYNVLFVAPLLAVLAVVAAGGERAERLTLSAREALQRYGPGIIPVLLALLGTALVVLGAVALLGG